MKAALLALFPLTLILTGCQFRPAEPADTAPKTKTKEPEQAAELDKTNAYISEIKVPMAKLGPSLRKLGKYDAHLTWTDAFIKETLTAASLLKKNDRLEGPMLAKVGEHTAQVNVIIIRLDEDIYALRIIGSHKPITDELEKVL
ncbi:MAG: hypothetical protein ACKVQS_03180, partial [Fimbriimonadaceae bacterium]